MKNGWIYLCYGQGLVFVVRFASVRSLFAVFFLRFLGFVDLRWAGECGTAACVYHMCRGEFRHHRR